MRYDNDAYRELFPKVEPVEQPAVVESPVETFKPTETVLDTKTDDTKESNTPKEPFKEVNENGCVNDGSDNGIDT